jgi:carbamoylphosphate synthase small subunit
MGNHMITHALGAKTFKLKFGHRGANQPVKNLETGKVSITAQNHGFAARPEDLEQRGAIVTEVNLNDGTVEGCATRTCRFSPCNTTRRPRPARMTPIRSSSISTG